MTSDLVLSFFTYIFHKRSELFLLPLFLSVYRCDCVDQWIFRCVVRRLPRQHVEVRSCGWYPHVTIQYAIHGLPSPSCRYYVLKIGHLNTITRMISACQAGAYNSYIMPLWFIQNTGAFLDFHINCFVSFQKKKIELFAKKFLRSKPTLTFVHHRTAD